MKIYILLLLFPVIFILACEDDNTEIQKDISNGFCLKIGEDFTISNSDIDYYDFSAHLIYLKESNQLLSEIDVSSGFTVYADKEEIYSGLFQPSYSSYLSTGPVIHSFPVFFGKYVISIDWRQTIDSMGNYAIDPRLDERIVKTLKKYNKYHEGLNAEIKSINYSLEKEMVVMIELKNTDSFNYYYLDPAKMGIGLFHYFTNGLRLLLDEKHQVYTHNLEIEMPDPWNFWSTGWLSLIKSNESKIIKIIYNNFDELPQGNYTAYFEFPGLSHQPLKNELLLADGRIWLGELYLSNKFKVQ